MNAYALLDRVRFRGFMRWLYRIELVGRENVPDSGGCILAPNHESIFDPFILGVATTREIRFMAKSELFGNRALAGVLRALGAFPVERGGGDHVAMSEAAELLRRGEVLGMFPQGTSKQLARRPWHRGAARLALVTGTPIVPVRMTGTRAVPLRTRVRIVVGEPIEVEEARPTVTATRALTERLEQAVSAL
ncbi:MAG TPA: lysophospholipid acyltransferase family protein [Gaiellaceae bacterium]|nr:lysophospholipid acyltransferase family protein [Gaiellaceae bacterium]